MIYLGFPGPWGPCHWIPCKSYVNSDIRTILNERLGVKSDKQTYGNLRNTYGKLSRKTCGKPSENFFIRNPMVKAPGPEEPKKTSYMRVSTLCVHT